MKTLSGRQPWWHCIIHLGKRIENRKWNTHYRGPILLHAAKGCTGAEYTDVVSWIREAFGDSMASQVPPLYDLPRGGIIGCARVVEVIPPYCAESLAESVAKEFEADLRWWMREQFGFVLADVYPLPFVACKGALSLFEANYP